MICGWYAKCRNGVPAYKIYACTHNGIRDCSIPVKKSFDEKMVIFFGRVTAKKVRLFVEAARMVLSQGLANVIRGMAGGSGSYFELK
jgi:hypothetical protein